MMIKMSGATNVLEIGTYSGYTAIALARYCSVLQYVAVCCSVLQCVALGYIAIALAVCCSVLQCVVVYCSCVARPRVTLLSLW